MPSGPFFLCLSLPVWWSHLSSFRQVGDTARHRQTFSSDSRQSERILRREGLLSFVYINPRED